MSAGAPLKRLRQTQHCGLLLCLHVLRASKRNQTNSSAIAERPRCRVRYSLRQK